MSKWRVVKECQSLHASTKKWITPAIIALILNIAQNAFSEMRPYTGFRRLKEEDCRVMKDASLVKLSPNWHRYAGFIKICELKVNSYSVSKVSVVSIWVNEYFEIKFPHGPRKWEKFPLPLIVDQDLSQIGQLPEIYPFDDVTSPDVYYGEWRKGMPTQIRVDVQNPAEGGDYHYKPFIWDEKLRNYRSLDMEIVNGRRPN